MAIRRRETDGRVPTFHLGDGIDSCWKYAGLQWWFFSPTLFGGFALVDVPFAANDGTACSPGITRVPAGLKWGRGAERRSKGSRPMSQVYRKCDCGAHAVYEGDS